MLQEFFRCRKTQPAVAPANSSALIGVEKPVDFRLADWLLKGDAGEHFERGGRETKTSARSALFTQICAQRLCGPLL